MSSTPEKSFCKILKLSFWALAIFALGACTDTSYNVPEDAAVVIVQPPEIPEPLSLVISGVVVDQITGDAINNARVDFFEGSQKATNILTVNAPTDEELTSIEGVDLTDGSFQVTAKDIAQFKVVASASGYLDKVALVNLDPQAKIVNVVVELLAEETEGVAANSDVFDNEIGVDYAVVPAGITLSSDSDDPDSNKTTEGQAEVAIPGGIKFLDGDQVIEVSAINLEVNYLESQEASEEDQQAVSIASLIPEGLNSDDDIDEVLVPVGVTEVNMTDANGTPIKKFSDKITITLYLPDTTIDPRTGSPITVNSEFVVRTFDSETLTWSTESGQNVNILPVSNGLFPVQITVDHLTIFALTSKVDACTNDVTFDFIGDTVPASGLDLTIESGDLRKTLFIPAGADDLVISSDEVKSSGIMKDEDGYKLYVEDSLGNSWLVVEEQAEPVETALAETVITVPEVQAGTQHVYVSDSQISEDGSQITVTLSYLADTANLTGVGMSVNFDSSVLSLSAVSNVFAGAIAVGSQSADSSDSDGDASTDQLLSFGWASLFGQFPGSTSADLAEVTFDIADGATGSTRLNFIRTSSTAGYTFDGQSQDLVISAEADDSSSDGYQLCVEEDIVLSLEAPAETTTVSEDLTLYLQCTNDSLIEPLLKNAVVTFTSDTQPIPQVATDNSSGIYTLSGLDPSSTYTVKVNTRTDSGIVLFNEDNDANNKQRINPDGNDEQRTIGNECSSVTGSGTGSGSGSGSN